MAWRVLRATRATSKRTLPLKGHCLAGIGQQEAGHIQPSGSPDHPVGGSPTQGVKTFGHGWADRVAEELSIGHEDFAYANLAVRGLLLPQILDEQVGPALALHLI